MKFAPLLALVLLAGCSDAPKGAQGRVLFEDNGMMFEVPAGWVWRNQVVGDTTFRQLAWDGGAQTLAAAAADLQLVPFDEIEGEQGFVILAREEVVVDSKPALLTEQRYPGGGAEKRRWHLFLPLGSRHAQVTADFPASSADKRRVMRDVVLSVLVR